VIGPHGFCWSFSCETRHIVSDLDRKESAISCKSPPPGKVLDPKGRYEKLNKAEKLLRSSSASAASNADQEEFNRSISSSTISMEIRPLRASLAMRTTTAFKSQKLRFQQAEGQVRVEPADLA
jgi:hypothetical protein